uniref:Ig-like domain-containing protein n=1 Tax=Neogobius melanostomus TaxID=47308 RepID=A0A8C6S577_9GOBI
SANLSHSAVYFCAASITVLWDAKAITFDPSNPRIVNPSTKVEINCHHDDNNMEIMLWYKQPEDGQMQLIVYSYVSSKPSFEKDFATGFEMRRTDKQTGALIISSVKTNDSATYYCAAREHSDVGQGHSQLKTHHREFFKLQEHMLSTLSSLEPPSSFISPIIDLK